MDFIRFIKSLEELLYEVATWLLFYPRTLWLAFRHPFRLAAYSERELIQEGEDRYTDVISPPMFLLLTLLLMHGIEMVASAPLADFRSPLARKLLDSDVNLLVFRSTGYSIFPLLMANAALRRTGVRVDRDTLRKPFYSQCFFVVPFVVLSSLATAIAPVQSGRYGMLLWLVSFVWYVTVQSEWFARKLSIGRARATVLAIRLLLCGILIVVGAAILLLLPDVVM